MIELFSPPLHCEWIIAVIINYTIYMLQISMKPHSGKVHMLHSSNRRLDFNEF